MDDYVFQDPRSIRRITGSSRETDIARDIVSADRSPPCVPRGREVCASWNAFPWREMVKKKGKGRETSRREARVKFDARGT